MHPEELHWLIDARLPVKMYGSMTESQVEQIYRETYGEPPDQEEQ